MAPLIVNRAPHPLAFARPRPPRAGAARALTAVAVGGTLLSSARPAAASPGSSSPRRVVAAASAGAAAPEPCFYDAMKTAFCADGLAPEFRGTYRFEILDDAQHSGGRFNIDVANRAAVFYEGDPSDKPKLTFKMTRGIFEQLRSGKLGGAEGFMTKKIQLEGVSRLTVFSKVPTLKKFDAMFPIR